LKNINPFISGGIYPDRNKTTAGEGPFAAQAQFDEVGQIGLKPALALESEC